MFLGLLDDGREVAPAAIFHHDVEDASVAINVAVVIAHNVLMMQIF